MKSVDESVPYSGTELLSFEWTPAAFIKYVLPADGPWIVRIDEDEIGMITFAYVPAITDEEAISDGMAHLPRDFFERDFSLVMEFEHGDE